MPFGNISERFSCSKTLPLNFKKSQMLSNYLPCEVGKATLISHIVDKVAPQEQSGEVTCSGVPRLEFGAA